MAKFGSHSWHKRKRHHYRVALFVNGVGVILNPNERTIIMLEVTLGHKIACSLVYLDTSGNPMLTQPAPDAAPVWSNTTAATETIVASADGTTCVATTVAAGTDSIGVALNVGGQAFTASLAVTVDPLPQTLGSVQIATQVQ